MTTRLIVDIENRAGTKQGYGPITSATNWQATARLNRAGEFSFSMPATDAMAAYVRPKSYARCYHADGFSMRCLGYGRIERVELRESEQGPLLNVSGSDLLGELADRIIHDRLAIRAEIREHPSYVTGATTEAADSTLKMHDLAVGDTSTYARLECDGLAGTPFVIGSIYKFHKITVNIGAETNSTHTVSFQFSKNDSWTDFTPTDGTGGFAASGDITFAPDTDCSGWEPGTGEITYKVKINFTGGDPNEYVDIQDISISYFGPTNTALGDILGYAPNSWTFDSDGYGELQNRPLTGTEIITNGGFEVFTGTEDDTAEDSWTGWIVDHYGIEAKALAVTGAHGGSYAVKLLTGSTGGKTDYCYVDSVNTVTGSTEYTLSYWAKGDGTNQGTLRIWHNSTPAEPISPLLYSGVTGSTWTKITYTFTTPANVTSISLVFYSPDAANSYCFVDDVSLQAGGGNAIYLQCSDESVLEMLVRCSEISGENFILSPDAFNSPPARKVLWLGKDKTDCGITAVSHVDPIAAEDNNFIALITNVTEIEDASEIVSRVYAYGAGMGGNRVTLANCTTQPPTGYVLSTSGNYVERTATETALGTRVELAKSWPDIVAQTDDNTAAAQSASNILMIQAVNWLETHSCTSLDRLTGDVPRFFELSLAKCNTMIYPGYQIRVRHHRFTDGYHAVSIDRDLWITAATWRVDRSGVQTVGLEVATVPRAAINDALATATSIRRIIGIQAHNTAIGY